MLKLALTTAENTITMETSGEPALPRKGSPGCLKRNSVDKGQRRDKEDAEAT